MTVHIEFFGIPRTRAGVSQVDVEAATLGEALQRVGRLLPAWAEACLADGRLQRGLIVNLNGQRFVSENSTVLNPGDSVLILSADVGG